MAVSALLNGTKEHHSLLASRAMAYGDGLFETIAYRAGILQLWDRHMARLLSGCDRLGLTRPDPVVLKSEALHLLGERTEGIAKILITRTTPHRGYVPIPCAGIDRIVQAFDWPYYPEQSDATKLGLCKVPISENAILAGMKHLNRLDHVLAANEVAENGWDEGLMCRSGKHVICGTKSNIFITRNDDIYTPDLSLCGVEGVMRAEVIERARELGFSVNVKDITRQELDEADSMFITNVLIGLVPVSEFYANQDSQVQPVVFGKHTIVESLKKLTES